jgi:hypothetical protein
MTVGGELPQAKAWAKFPRPFGPTAPVLPNVANAKPLVIPDRTPGPIQSPITSFPALPASSHLGYWLLAIGYGYDRNVVASFLLQPVLVAGIMEARCRIV